MAWGGVFIVALFVFFSGKGKNNTLAIKWKRACSEVISQNFAHFGLTNEPSIQLE